MCRRAGARFRGGGDEVRKLAERTTESIHTIATIVEKVQAGARKAAQEMEGGTGCVNEGVELAN